MKRMGAYYREKVLSRNDLKEVYIPSSNHKAEIQQDLFGWRLYLGPKKVVECRSEEEARYLKIFADALMSNVMVPKDDEYLKNILPELEDLKRRHDEIIRSHQEDLSTRSLRKQLHHMVWGRLMYEEPDS